MRIGAIFARGSCRALKWTALFGMVFALGSAQVAAQSFDGATLVVPLAQNVYGNPALGDWTVTVSPGVTPALTVMDDGVPALIGAATNSLTMTLSGPIPSGSTVDVGYSESTSTGLNRLFDAATASNISSISAVTLLEVDTAPVLPDLSSLSTTVSNGDAVSIMLPLATGGNGTITYNVGPLPAGLTFNAPTPGPPATPPSISGPAGAATSGPMTIRYEAQDNDSALSLFPASSNGRDDQVIGRFTITVTDVPAAPTAVTVTATGSPTGLAVSWTAGANNNLAVTDHDLRYSSDGGTTWTVVNNIGATTSYMLTVPASGMYMVQVRARNADGLSPWSASGNGTTGTAPGAVGQITAMELTGTGVSMKSIGGSQRYHLTEGVQTVDLSVTVQWTHAELTGLYGAGATAAPAQIVVQIKGDQTADQTYALPDWLSWIDDEGDVDFPNTPGTIGRLTAMVSVAIAAKPNATEFPNSTRHVRSRTGKIRLLVLHDDHEAENDAFYIDAVSSADVDLNAGSARNQTTLLTVIEDDEDQEVTVKRGRDTSSRLSESVGSAEFIVAADPPRMDLPLDVRLDVIDLGIATVKADTFSLSDASLTLNPGRDGTGNSTTVTLRVPDPDGNREDDRYDLRASVVVYSLSSGGYDTIPVVEHRIDVIDVHKLPPITVSPATGTVMEGGEIELTLTIDRNPEETIATSASEILEYTPEALNVMLSPAADSTATAMDYSITPNPVPVGEHDGRARWEQTVKVTIAAAEDEDVDPDRTLMLNFLVNGTEDSANGTRPTNDMGPDAQATLTIEDDTDKLVSIKADAYEVIKRVLGDPPTLQKGMSGTLTGGDLFDYAPTAVSVAYGTAVLDGGAVSASASGGTVTITGVSAGTAKVEITATATPNGSTLIPNQTKANVAQITFPVNVVLADLSVTVAAADMVIMEGGSTMITATASRMIEASDPTVQIDLDVVGDATLSADSITIAAGSMTGSAMVTATEDDDYMDETVTVVASGSGITGSTQVAIAVTDNDDPPEPPAATVTAKTEAEVQAVFDSAVADARTGSDWYEGGTAAMVDMSALFNVADGASPAYSGVSSDAMVASATASGMMLTLMPMSEGMATITVTAVDSASGDSDTASGMVTVADLPLEVAVSAPAMVAEGGSVMITATANKMIDADVMVMLTRDGASSAGEDDYTVGELMIAMGETTGTAELTATDDYEVEGNEGLTLSAMVGDMSAGMVMITIEDNDVDTTYTLSASEAMVAEGGSVTITATASQMVRENTEVMVMRDASSTAGDDDYSLDPVMITIMMGETTGTATLTATDDYEVEGNESLTLNGMVGDMAAGMVMVTIEDDDAETTYMLSADPTMVMEGGEVTITATASQMVRENTEVMVMRDAASTAGADDYSVAPPLITIMMGETTGSLTLTATDDTMVEGDESLTLNGMVGDMAAGSVMIAINDNDVVSAFTLSGPMDMNLVEGESYELTVTADPAVQMDTEVMIMRDRSMSDADDADFTVEPVTIMAGETMGTTMLMIEDDGPGDAGHGMPEMLVVFGMVDGMETNSLTFYTWDMAVPALPLIAQLLLAAFLAIGGYRRYLRR